MKDIKLDKRIQKYFGSNFYKIPFLTFSDFQKINKQIKKNIQNGIEKDWIQVDKSTYNNSFFIIVDSPDFYEMRIWEDCIEFRNEKLEAIRNNNIFNIYFYQNTSIVFDFDYENGKRMTIDEYKKYYKKITRELKMKKLNNLI